MTTTTSYSDGGRFKALYKSALRRSIGYFGLLSILLLIFYPFQYALRVFRELTESQQSWVASGGDLMEVCHLTGMGMQHTLVSAVFYTMILLVAPIVLALVLNSYMHSKKAADVYHSLPVKRETILGINTLVAMTIITIPVLACNLLVILFQTIKFGFHPFLVGQILIDMCGWLVVSLFVYVITAIVCTQVGTTFDAFIFSGILMVSVPVILGIYTGLASIFLYGFEPNEIFLETLLDLCPFSLMPTRLAFSNYITQTGFDLTPEKSSLLMYSNIAIGVYFVLAVALLFVAKYLYRRRNSELAETTTSKGFLQVIIKFLGTLIGGIAVGLLFYSVNGTDSASGNMMFIMWSLIGGILIYTIIEVILNRGFKSVVKSIPLGVAMVAVMSLSTVVFLTGGFGYENRVPQVDAVDSIEISYMGRFDNYASVSKTFQNTDSSDWYYESVNSVTLPNPEQISVVLDYHEDMVAHKYERHDDNQDFEPAYSNTKIIYHLKNGKTLRRYYSFTSVQTLLKLAQLETNPEFLAQTNPAFIVKPDMVSKWKITNAFGTNKMERIFTEQESAALLDAIQADLLDETTEDLLHPTDNVLAIVTFDVERPTHKVYTVLDDEKSKIDTNKTCDQGCFYVTSKQQNTWKLLEEKGLTEQIEPDLSKCTAVVAENFYNTPHSAITQALPDDTFLTSELQMIKEEIDRREEETEEVDYGSDYMFKYGYNESLNMYEDQALIEQMAQQVVATGSIEEPMVSLRFFFEDSEEGCVTMVPLSKLPKNIQIELKTPTEG